MSNFVFNNAKGKVAYYAELPEANDALIAIPMETASLEIDATLVGRETLDDVLSTSSEQTTLGRKTLTGVTSSVVGNTAVVNADDFTYTSGTGAPVGAFIVCYVPDLGVSGDEEIVPLLKFDFSLIPSGVDIPVQIATGGLFVASSSGL